MEAGVTDPDGGQAPAPLWDRTGLGGAGVAEALPTGTAVVLIVILLEHLAARVAFLHGRKRHTHECTNFVNICMGQLWFIPNSKKVEM